MRPSDLDAVRQRTRRLYELGRGRRALVGILPAVALGVLASRSTRETLDPAASAALLATVSVAFLWRGQHAGRAVLPGVMAGVFPFAAALGVSWVGETRFALCAAVSFLASGVGGLLLARNAQRSEAKGRAWIYAGMIAILTGSVACSCIGLGGFVGLLAGLATVAAPSLLLRSSAAQ